MPSDFAAVIGTPSPSADILSTQTHQIPWLTFSRKFDEDARLGAITEEPLWAVLSRLHLGNPQQDQLQSIPTTMEHLYSLNIDVPGTYGSESEHAAKILLHGSPYEKARETLRILFYYLSNNVNFLDNLEDESAWNDEQFWHGIQSIFEATGILHHRVQLNLRENEDYTISAFCEKLFTALIYHITDLHYPCQDDFCFQLLRWLLESGQDPNVDLRWPDDPHCPSPPIGFAAFWANVKLTEMLLAFEADPNPKDSILLLLLLRKYEYDGLTVGVYAEEISRLKKYHVGKSDPGTDESTICDPKPDQSITGNIDTDKSLTGKSDNVESITGDTDSDESITSDTDTDEGIIGDLFIDERIMDNDSDENTILDLVLRSIPDSEEIVDIDGCLLMSLQHGDIFVSRKLLKRGANLLARERASDLEFHGCLYDMTALSAICAFKPSLNSWSEESPLPVQFVIDILRDLDFDVLADEHTMADALISATLSGNHDTIQYLVGIGGDVNARNKLGITALHASACLSTYKTCQLLLELGADPNCSEPGYPSPMHVACVKVNSGVARLLISAGANLQHKVDPATFSWSKHGGGVITLIGFLSMDWPGGLRTPLEFLTGSQRARNHGHARTSLGMRLIAAGAVPTAPSLVNAVLSSDIKFLKACLLAGGGRNEVDKVSNSSILSLALVRGDADCAFLLLRAGAEVVWDELCIAATLVRKEKDREVFVTTLMKTLRENSKVLAPPASLFLPAFWDGTTRAIPDAFESWPYGYCSLGMLLAVSASIEANDLSLVMFLLSKRQEAGRQESDVTNSGVRHVSRNSMLPIAFGRSVSAMEMMRGGYQPDTLSLKLAITLQLPSLVECIISRRPLLETAPISDDMGPLYVAVQVGAVGILEMLLTEGVTNYEINSRIALCKAIELEKRSMIDMLLSRGIGIHSPAITSGQKTALQQAVLSRNISAIDRLLKADVKVNQAPAHSYGATALQYAAINGRTDIAKVLIENGAEVNAPGSKTGGRTTLEGAAEYGHLDMAKMLLNRGFDTTGKPGRVAYIKAVGYAHHYGHSVLEDMLRKHRDWTCLDKWLEENLSLDNRLDCQIDSGLVDFPDEDEIGSSSRSDSDTDL
ncbi:hypothetical protein DL768_004080 [Monosporascus sp. mg162]|nr:hypothetical protein DL768_004080 [Monosporascus sp. mg162]